MKKLTVMVSAVLAWIGSAQWAAAQSKPNVILIMTDQQRGEHTTLPQHSERKYAKK